MQGVRYSSKGTGDVYGWDTIERLEALRDDRGLPFLQVWRDENEWADYRTIKDQVVHIQLAKRNHVLCVAPLCANTLATLATGGSNTLLSEVVRAWYWDLEPAFAEPLYSRFGRFALRRPVLLAPAMNTYMWCVLARTRAADGVAALLRCQTCMERWCR